MHIHETKKYSFSIYNCSQANEGSIKEIDYAEGSKFHIEMSIQSNGQVFTTSSYHQREDVVKQEDLQFFVAKSPHGCTKQASQRQSLEPTVSFFLSDGICKNEKYLSSK